MNKQSKSREPLVSVITVNYNTPADVCEMIQSLKENDYQNIEIIVVDNNSQKEDPELITNTHPDVELIRSKDNLGFAGGNNIGIKRAKGEYILF